MSVATDPATRGRIAVDRITDFVDEAIAREEDADRRRYPDADTRRGVIYSPRLRPT
ncbi:hypothetical protein GRS96_12350 [Rathayibacter sp. VKM Ac-2803]|uniref:hypothetical protein n=1 Tax=Rathayibacter sp. VKM Ac-2803 TaxID=2609256 RepID=UPI00135C83EE|nr:hypothetical protein [Rathayibacter sp. VKM Ac-2803]MWV50060.1 hypothetical protein [Rathayibacter sp. VKM Ac-2803]